MTHKSIASLTLVAMLASCTTVTVQESLPKTCALIESVHSGFLLVSAAGDVPAKTVTKELAAYEGAQVFCRDPSSVTAANAPILAAQLYLTLLTIIRSAT